MSEKNKKVGSAMVIGGGIGGMQAALDLAESGIKVHFVEKSSAIGGRMTQLDKTFPTNECAMCVVSPKLVECGRHPDIDIITNAEIIKIDGVPGNFKITLYRRSRYVDREKCTGCEDCAAVCPVEVTDKFNGGIGTHKAIYRLYPQAVPLSFVIDKEKRAPCVTTCPARINVQGYIALASRGKFKEAFDLIRHRVPFPGVLGRVCYHPCEGKCNRKDVDQPLAINPLKRFVADFVYKNRKSELFTTEQRERRNKSDDEIPHYEEEEEAGRRTHPYSFDEDITDELVEARKGKRVAVVGAGPCGLTAADDLARLGYRVTVFEAEKTPGGMMAFGIPSYRLPKDLLKLEIDNILKKGIEMETGKRLGKDITFQGLKENGYEAVLLATGAGKTKTLTIPGADNEQVWQGVEFLKNVNSGEKVEIEGELAIIGGGNVAIDVARTAKRLGASGVHIICLESRDEMPAHDWEIELAGQEGITIHPSWSPVRIEITDNQISAVRFKRCLNAFDETGRFNPVCNDKEEYRVDVRHVIVAIGQRPELAYLAENDRLRQTTAGTIEVDPVSFSTTDEGVFAGGDAVSGPASVIEAIASGKEAALSIDRYIRGVDVKEGRGEKAESSGTPDIKFDTGARTVVRLLSPENRINNFDEVELTITEGQAMQEAARCMNCGICSECMECEKVCGPGAVNHNMKDEITEIRTGAVIIATGVEHYDPDCRKEYGSDRYKNVLTSVQFERILSSSGPTGGEVLRPSDGKRPGKIAFLQCVGSRDPSCGNEFCSAVCCMYSIKEAVIVTEHDPEIEATVFYIDMRTFGKEFERYYEIAENEHGVKFIRCMVSKIYEMPETGNLCVKYIDDRGNVREAEFDMVVLAVGLTSTLNMKPLATTLGIELNEYGFIRTKRNEPGKTSKEGIFAAGTCVEPKDIPETVTEGSSAASLASALLKDERGKMVSRKTYPPERDIENEDIRIGVFICHCGRNIASVVNVSEVVERASRLKDVVFAGEFLYTCSEDSLDSIRKRIGEYDINRVVVASCTPHTHEELFRDTVRQAGLNKYLFEMTSIREQVSWVHKDLPAESTRKAGELVEMMVARVRLTKPLGVKFSGVIPKALVIGGGASGMRAALSIAEQGYDVFLVEKEERLGGHLSEIYENLGGEDPPLLLDNLIDKVQSHERIEVMTSARLESLSGFMGNYTSGVDLQGKKIRINHGIVVVATGGKAYKPGENEYGWGRSPDVITQVIGLSQAETKKKPVFAGAVGASSTPVFSVDILLFLTKLLLLFFFIGEWE